MHIIYNGYHIKYFWLDISINKKLNSIVMFTYVVGCETFRCAKGL